MRFRLAATAAFALGAACVPAAALAHPKLVSANPAADASVAPTSTITLTFNEKLMPKLSSARLTMTGMPGMANHPEMDMKATSSVAADGKSIVLKSAKPLPAGSYRADWVIVGPDTHRITGAHSFKVK